MGLAKTEKLFFFPNLPNCFLIYTEIKQYRYKIITNILKKLWTNLH